jgi:hypothetical protein
MVGSAAHDDVALVTVRLGDAEALNVVGQRPGRSSATTGK